MCGYSTDKLTRRSSWLDGLFYRTWAGTHYKDANDLGRKEREEENVRRKNERV
jgi:hypothetical protein